MDTRDIVVIGASAGGIETLIELCRQLPRDLPAAVFVVVHTAPTAPGMLPRILQRKATVDAYFPRDGDPIAHDKFYIAPPNQHLVLEPNAVRVTSGPRENGLRPSVDTLFRSAAYAFGQRVVGVVLSGTRSDGSAGLLVIKENGGKTIVQDPDEALFPGMPESAMRTLMVDFVLPVNEIAHEISRPGRKLPTAMPA